MDSSYTGVDVIVSGKGNSASSREPEAGWSLTQATGGHSSELPLDSMGILH